MRVRSGILALGLLLTARGALAEPAAEPAAPAPLPPARCTSDDAVPTVGEPWVHLRAEPSPGPFETGHLELFRFRVWPSGERGRALVARMARSDGNAPLFRGEKRSWAVVVELVRGARVVGYAYLDEARSPNLWVYVPELRRFSRVDLPRAERMEPTERLCEALGATGLATEVEIEAWTVGRVEPDSRFRRAIDVDPSRCR